ncbi:MAG: hypothetical protein QNJ84_05115 [Alphaproteobacteria bacterium]|nr:hypothetical protein [Alphaproteobacteria bacterium]
MILLTQGFGSWLRSETGVQIRNWRDWPFRSSALVTLKALGAMPAALLLFLYLNPILAEVGAPFARHPNLKGGPYTFCMDVPFFYLMHYGVQALVSGALLLWVIRMRSLSGALLAVAIIWIMLDVFFITIDGSELLAPNFSSAPFLEPFCRSLWERWG